MFAAGGVVKQRNKVGYGKLVGVGDYDYGNWNGGQRSPYGTGAICMRGKVDTTFFRREIGKNFIIVKIYVNDIIFGDNNESLC